MRRRCWRYGSAFHYVSGGIRIFRGIKLRPAVSPPPPVKATILSTFFPVGSPKTDIRNDKWRTFISTMPRVLSYILTSLSASQEKHSLFVFAVELRRVTMLIIFKYDSARAVESLARALFILNLNFCSRCAQIEK